MRNISRVVHIQPDEPPEQEVVVELLHQQPLAPDRVEIKALTPLYVKTLVQAAWTISWRARKSVMTRW